MNGMRTAESSPAVRLPAGAGSGIPRSRRRPFVKPTCLPAGEREGLQQAWAPDYPGMTGREAREKGCAWGVDRTLEGAAKRSCSACGKRFQPTLRRRMLCEPCYEAGRPVMREI